MEQNVTKARVRLEYLRPIILWVISLAVVWTFLSQLPYTPKDGDGWLYTHIAEEVSSRGLGELIAIQWYGECKIYDKASEYCRYFYEHPPGLFILPVLLTKIGIPKEKATLFADTLYQLILLLGIYLLASHFLPRKAAELAAFAVLLLPISFVYSMRATQETPLLMCLCLSIVVVLKTNLHPILRCGTLVLLAAFAALLKGIMVVPLVVIVCASVFFFTAKPSRFKSMSLVFFLMVVGAYLVLSIFDKVRMAMTGNSFWLNYLDIQLWHRSLEPVTFLEFIRRTLSHFVFYIGCIAWYSFPWSLIFGYIIFKKSKNENALKLNRPTRVLLVVLAFGTILHLFAFSLFARYSMRYIFPAYHFTALVVFLLAYGKGYLRYLEKIPYGRLISIESAAIFWCFSRSILIVIN